MQPTIANQQKRGQFKKIAVKVIEWIRKSLALGKNEVFTHNKADIILFFLFFFFIIIYFSVSKSTLLSVTVFDTQVFYFPQIKLFFFLFLKGNCT